MPASSDIYGQIQQPQQPNLLAQLAQTMQIQGAMGQNQLAQYGLKKAQRGDEETNALADAIRGGLDLATPEGQAKAYGVAPTVAPAYVKSHLEAQKERSIIGENKAKTDKLKTEDVNLAVQQSRDMLGSINDPQAAAAWVQAQYANPKLAPVHEMSGRTLEQAIAAIPTDPAKFAQWKQQNQLGADKLVTFTTPDANTVANNTTSVANNAATNAAHIKATGMTNVTSRANNKDTITAENMRSGVTADGSITPDIEAQAQAIAKGQLMPPSGAALINPKNARVLARVMQINPDYDATTVLAKRKAAADFTSGTLGNALRSVSTANAHLDQLGELADAMQNGDTQVVNKVANYFSKATGNPAVTNFDAIKAIVGQEVVKAIVAGGGGVGEREEAAKIFSSASSPAQLKGAIQHYRMVMGAQANNLIEQRRAAGLPDSTLPNYGNTNPSAGAEAAPSAGGLTPAEQKELADLRARFKK